MIHEKQVRQLCAVHTVNNLLQIPSCFKWCEPTGDAKSSNVACRGYSADTTPENNTSENDDNPRIDSYRQIHRWSCSRQVLHQFEQPPSSMPTAADQRWRAATQVEFDEIAQEITMRESLLMEGIHMEGSDENEQTSHDNMPPSRASHSTLQKIFSHHGTPFLGNYSLEVLQVALNRRGVILDCLRMPEVGGEADIDTDASNTAKISSFHVGYIVYDQRHSLSSYLKRIGKYVPILKHFCQGKHWYAITRMCYHCKEINDSLNSSKPIIKANELDKIENKSTGP
eukprot:CCRYP_009844-RA/>CCRYP_009844-RA protein AED:0.03 eAED:0.03 QI:87/1/1/1/0/0/2/348/283